MIKVTMPNQSCYLTSVFFRSMQFNIHLNLVIYENQTACLILYVTGYLNAVSWISDAQYKCVLDIESSVVWTPMGFY